LTGAAANREKIERWFTRQGLTLFVHGRGKQRSFRVGQGVVGIAWLLEVLAVALLAPREPWLSAYHLLAVSAAVLVLAGSALVPVWAVGRRPIPITAAIVLVIFVMGPAVAPLVFGQPVLAAAVAGVNLALLVLSYLLLGGVVALTQWAIGEIRRQMLELVGILARTLPFLFIGIAILFLTSEVWQLAANIHWQFLLITLGVFLVVGTMCLLTRLVTEVRDCCAAAEELDLADAAARIRGMSSAEIGAIQQLDGVDLAHSRRPPSPTTLEKINMGLLLLFAQSLQILGVSVALGAILLVFGVLAIPPETAASFLPDGRPVRPVAFLPSATLWGQQVVFTQELLTVTAIVAGFAYLSFVFFAVTRDDYAHEFLKHVHARIGAALALRRVYLTTLWAPRRERLGRRNGYRLTFEVPPAFNATEAIVVGGLDGSEVTGHRMSARPGGGFSHQERLPAGGRYRYYYEIDGTIYQDCGADDYSADETGRRFSIVTVPPMRLESP
jgi:hypothetical protein